MTFKEEHFKLLNLSLRVPLEGFTLTDRDVPSEITELERRIHEHPFQKKQFFVIYREGLCGPNLVLDKNTP